MPVTFIQDEWHILLQHEIRSHYRPKSEKDFVFIDFGGGVKDDESMYDTAAREFLEEIRFGVEDLLAPYHFVENDVPALADELRKCPYGVKGKGKYVCFVLPVAFVPSYRLAQRLMNLDYKGQKRKIQTFWWFPMSRFRKGHLPIHTRLKIRGLAGAVDGLKDRHRKLMCVDDLSKLIDDKSLVKEVLRRMVWESMDCCEEIKFPRPCFGRIPNYVGSEKAAQILCRSDAFKKANVVKVNPSLAQEECRYLTLKYGKTLLTPSPALENVFMYQVDPSSLPEESQRFAATKPGAVKFGTELSVKAWSSPSIQIDLLIVASVAVCPRTGARLGKGKGYGELEWAIFGELGAIHSGTVVATTVSESQIVYDVVFDGILEPHDLKVDLIATPERLIVVPGGKVSTKKAEIIWSLLSEEKIQEIPALLELRSRAKDNSK